MRPDRRDRYRLFVFYRLCDARHQPLATTERYVSRIPQSGTYTVLYMCKRNTRRVSYAHTF